MERVQAHTFSASQEHRNRGNAESSNHYTKPSHTAKVLTFQRYCVGSIPRQSTGIDVHVTSILFHFLAAVSQSVIGKTETKDDLSP